MVTQYTVRTGVFEGPLELLLQLVEKRKLFINDIALSDVADDYVSYSRDMGSLPIHETANFVVIAATLILIKSRSLLPQIEISPEEEQSIEELQKRLKAYKRIKELSVHVCDKFGRNIIFPRKQRKIANHSAVFSPDRLTTVTNLHKAMFDVLGRIPKQEKTPQASIRKIISLEETIEKIITRVTDGLTLSFKEFSGYGEKSEERVMVIVSFLAILELVKQGSLSVQQEVEFSDISIDNQHITTPMYR